MTSTSLSPAQKNIINSKLFYPASYLVPPIDCLIIGQTYNGWSVTNWFYNKPVLFSVFHISVNRTISHLDIRTNNLRRTFDFLFYLSLLTYIKYSARQFNLQNVSIWNPHTSYPLLPLQTKPKLLLTWITAFAFLISFLHFCFLATHSLSKYKSNCFSKYKQIFSMFYLKYIIGYYLNIALCPNYFFFF